MVRVFLFRRLFMKRLKVSLPHGLQELLRGHLQRDHPRFHKALGLRVHVGGNAALLGMLHILPSQHFHGCGDEVHVLHLDERTSQMEACGMNLHAAIPSLR
jgi:hypothetical protein